MTLSDKTIKCVCGGDDKNRRVLYHEKDIRQSLKNIEFKILKKFGRASHLIMKIIKEEMGDKLI